MITEKLKKGLKNYKFNQKNRIYRTLKKKLLPSLTESEVMNLFIKN